MKILHVIPSVPNVRGGPSQAVLDMVKALRASNIDAEIATTNDNGDGLLDVPLQKRIEYQQVPVWFFSRFSPKIKAVSEYAFSWDLTLWLWQNISRYDILHIHAIFSYTSTMAMAIARLKNVPYIVMPHGLLCEWSLQQSTRKKQIYLKLIEQANLNHSQVINFTSEKEQQEVAQMGIQAPCIVLPLGLSPLPTLIPDAHHRLRQYLNIPLDKPVILFLSRLHPKKGLDYLISALGKLIHYQFTFVIAGCGSKEYEQEIESFLVSSEIRDRTVFAGFVEGETKNIFLQGADLFALTSHSESFAVVVLEALAAGIPVLVTPGVALASEVQKYKLGYVPELDVPAIKSAIEQYLTSPQEAKDMGDRARQIIEKQYSWEYIAGNLTKVYTAIHQQTPLPVLSR